VSPDAVLGADVTVGPYAVIGPKVTIGDGTVIGAHACIDGTTTIGVKNTIGRHACIGASPQDLKYKGEETFLIVGDNNWFGDFVQLCRGTLKSHDRTTRLGNNNYIMAYSHVGHDCIVSDFCVLANGAQLAGHVELEDHVHFGGLAGVHQFCLVGKYCMIGGGSPVNSHLPPFTRAAGYAGPIVGMNTVGLKRSAEFTDEDRKVIKEVYRLFFKGAGPTEKLIEAIRAAHGGNRHAEHFCKFVERCRTGTAAGRPISRE
jgi:UDP-N-acetylglucosamine acyltransferase